MTSFFRRAGVQHHFRRFSTGSTQSPDVVIIGSGIIGASTALSLGRRGAKVLVVDRLPAAGSGSTSYSSGICRMHYSLLDSVKFSWEGYHYWKNWEEHLGVHDSRGYARFRECGVLMLKTQASASFLEKVIPHFQQVGIPFEMLDRHQLSQKFGENGLGFDLRDFTPAKRIDNDHFGEAVSDDIVEGALFSQAAGYVSDPQLATLNVQLAAEATGNVRFLFGKNVVKIKKDSSGTRITGISFEDGTTVDSKVVVNVGGPHSNQVTQMAFHGVDPALNDMSITTRALRQEVAYLRAPPGVDPALAEDGLAIPIMCDLDTGAYLRPEVGSKVLVGGVEPDCDRPLHFVDDPESANPSLTDEHTNFSYRAALRIPRMELPSASDTQGIVAFYDVTEDWAPIYDRSLLKGYYMAIGTSGNQFKCAPPAGELMAEVISRCEEDLTYDHDANPLQLPLVKTKCGSLNSGLFSRRRSVLETTGSVIS